MTWWKSNHMPVCPHIIRAIRVCTASFQKRMERIRGPWEYVLHHGGSHANDNGSNNSPFLLFTEICRPSSSSVDDLTDLQMIPLTLRRFRRLKCWKNCRKFYRNKKTMFDSVIGNEFDDNINITKKQQRRRSATCNKKSLFSNRRRKANGESVQTPIRETQDLTINQYISHPLNSFTFASSSCFWLQAWLDCKRLLKRHHHKHRRNNSPQSSSSPTTSATNDKLLSVVWHQQLQQTYPWC